MTIGLDTNMLCYALDPAYKEHEKAKHLLLELSPNNPVALNPTVLHEAYHTLVYYLEWIPEEASKRLSALLRHPFIEFYSQTRRTSLIALNLSVKYDLGGRDALITANYMANKIHLVYTHDKELLKLREIAWKAFNLTYEDPLIEI